MGIDEFFRTYRRAVVYDTEFTTWEGALARGWSGADEHREIIQISALKIDLVHEEITDSFNRFVRPRKNPQLSEYAKQLTGITQEQVDTGVDIKEMYTDLLAWADFQPLCSYARGAGHEGEGEVFRENMELYALEMPYPSERFINLVSLFVEAGVQVGHFTSGQLHTCFDIEVPGSVHDATHDVHSLVVSLLALKAEPRLRAA